MVDGDFLDLNFVDDLAHRTFDFAVFVQVLQAMKAEAMTAWQAHRLPLSSVKIFKANCTFEC